MTDLTDSLKRLINPRRGRGLLAPAASRDAIAVSRSIAYNSEPESGSGVTSPLVEQAYTGSTFYSLTSSDGFFVFEFGDETTYIDNDGTGAEIVIKNLDPDA